MFSGTDRVTTHDHIYYYYYIDRRFNKYPIFCVVLFHVQHYCPAYTDLESEFTGR